MDNATKAPKAVNDGLVMGKITDADVEMMRRRIGYPNPTLRKGVITKPWNTYAHGDAIRRWAESVGDMNPLYNDEGYASSTRWGGTIAPPGFEWSMGIDRNPVVSPDMFQETRHALRGVQLFHSGAEYIYYRPITVGVRLYKSECVGDVEEKQSRFATRSVIVNNATSWWDENDVTYINSSRWFVHAERKAVPQDGESAKKKPKDPLASYTPEQLTAIEEAYDSEYIRGADTLYLEDIDVGQQLPTMVKGPLTITDMINLHMGGGWLTYGNPPYRLAYENRKRLRGFYSKNEFGAWDTVQRVHWDLGLAQQVGVQHTYDIGPMRFVMVCNYVSNYAGDDSWVHRIRYELRNFNYVGDTTWITATVTAARVDETLGPLIELEIVGTNQRGQQNITAQATILVSSRVHGPVVLPNAPPVTSYRRTHE
ncbi:FAS1-like dehydratase domain-containing protein [Pseudomonas sp. NFX224]|uniref:FAS1-like dehydratase domain-containing protein n=1 Tax=Pseudomonas sp. NFX224 TaxID=3402862 RepID=UPI003AFA94DD